MALSSTVGSSTEFAYTGGMQEITIPVDGIYKLEVWGAQGGSINGGGQGAGGYSIGYKQLKKDTQVYVCCGASGFYYSPATGNYYYAYNGGGAGGHAQGNWIAAGGGGATHMALVTGTISSIGKSNFDQYGLIVAGGGGGGYQSGMGGGSGGGTSGGNGTNHGKGGSQTSGGSGDINGSFGTGATCAGWNGGTSGGGGYYGGGGCGAYAHGHAGGGGGGGSGWIGGVPSFTSNGVTYSPSTSNGVNNGAGKAAITLAALLVATVTYNGNGGSTPSAQTADIGSSLTGTSTRAGYKFDGWYTAASGGTKRTTIEATETLYAHWTPNTYTVTFNNNGGTNSTTSKTVSYNSTYGALPAPTLKTGTFIGWFDSNGNQITSDSTYTILGNTTLTAKYKYYYGIYVKINGHWKLGSPFTKQNGTWL